jgi:hypothetical protein
VPGQLVTISVGSANHVIGVNAGGQMWRWDNASNNWQSVGATFLAAEVSVGKDGTTYAVARDDNVYRLQGSEWVQVPGQLTQVSVFTADEVVGVNRSGQVYQLTRRRRGRQWTLAASR